MINFIYNKLLGKTPLSAGEARERLGSRTSILGIIVNLLLFAGKFTVGLLTGFVSVRADAINNLSDAGSSVVSLISFKLSSKPADRDHPYGHARIEYIASMIVSFLILYIGFDLLTESVGRILNPEKTEFSIVSIAVLSASVLAKLWLWYVNRGIGNKISSDVIKATAADSLSDAIATSAVIAAMLIGKFTSLDTDGYMGTVVAVIIMIAGVKILLETKDHILGGAPDPELVENIKAMVDECPQALGIHDMFIHNYGPGRVIASLHIEVDGSANIFDVHDAIDNVERRISSELGVICTIHMDPIVTDDKRVCELREQVLALVREIDQRLNIHDFRFVEGRTHSNLIFDVSAPFEVKMSDEELKRSVSDAISRIDPNYFAVITIDRL